MIIKDYENGKLLILSKPFDTREKFLAACYASVFMLSFCFVSFMFFTNTFTPVGGLFCLISFVVSFLIFRRFANKAFLSEQIYVTKNEIKLIQKKLFGTEQTTYDVGKISHFRHLGKPELTRHPLAGDNFDYLGFQTEQKLINDVHGDDRLSFQYEGKKITFGNNVYSWDFEQLEVILYDVTGKDLRYEDNIEKQIMSELGDANDQEPTAKESDY